MICFAVEPDLHHSMLLIVSICDIYIQLDYYYTLVDSTLYRSTSELETPFYTGQSAGSNDTVTMPALVLYIIKCHCVTIPKECT